jgi:hypothetical protein
MQPHRIHTKGQGRRIMATDPNIEFMGQKMIIPTSPGGVVGLCGVLASIVFVAYFAINGLVDVVTRGNPQNLQTLGSLLTSKQISNDNGKPEVSREDTESKIG